MSEQREACNIYYCNGVNHCRTCGREWSGNYPRRCQSKKPLHIVRSGKRIIPIRDFLRVIGSTEIETT
jgi:hypothetical protein